MPNCRECGEKLAETDNFCPKCGAQIPSEKPKRPPILSRIPLRKVLVGIIIIAVVVGTWTFFLRGNPVIKYAKMIPEEVDSEEVDSFFMVSGKVIKASEEGEMPFYVGPRIPDYLDVDPSDVEFAARAGYLSILSGPFDKEDVRDELEDRDFDKDEYRGVEVWEGETHWGGKRWVAIQGDEIICGNEDGVKSSIRVIKEGEESFYSEREARTLIDKLKYGDAIGIDLDPYEQYDELEAEASSFKMLDEDGEEWNAQILNLFEDVDSAEDAMDDIEDDIEESIDDEDWDYEDLDVQREGKMVEVLVKELDTG